MVASAELCLSVVAENGLPVISLGSKVAGRGFAFSLQPSEESRIVKIFPGNARNVLIASILEFEIEVKN